MSRRALPVLRWLAVVWLLVYVPAYASAYGLANFLFLCNVSVLLVAIGLWRGSAVLLSSQAIGSLLVSGAWTVDALGRLATGVHPIGGTEYMWDKHWPLFTRLLSLYHPLLPIVTIWGIARLGYDRRGLALQSVIAVAGVAAGRALGPAANINAAFVDPIFKRSWGPAPIHVAVVAGTLVLVVYPLTHLLLSRVFASAEEVATAAV